MTLAPGERLGADRRGGNDRLEPLLKIPYVLSPGWLEIDPTFDPLRENPRFRKIVAGAK